jgi:glycosyl transferase family 87
MAGMAPLQDHAGPSVAVVRRDNLWEINWRRLARRSFIAGTFVLAAVQLAYSASGNEYGLDFLGGTWHAGKAVLKGLNPYPQPEWGWPLLHASSGFMTPPPLALVGVPFSLLPFWAAVLSFNLVCAGAAIIALRVLDVSDRRVWLLALCSFPFVSSLALGQPDGLFVLAAACAWRWRDDRWWGGVAAGALIAAKLLAWPLVIWLLVTRRTRQAAVLVGSTLTLALGSWAVIGFRGLGAYLQLLRDDARTYEYRSHSLVSGFMHLGTAIAAAVVLVARASDGGWFTAALLLGILTSPIVWDHYLVALIVCLAAIRRSRDALSWVLIVMLWMCPVENPANLWQAWIVPLIAGAVALRIGHLSRTGAQDQVPKPAWQVPGN